MKTRDLADSADPEVRLCLLRFYDSLVTGQYDKLDVMRAQIFKVVETHAEQKADLEALLHLLNSLTSMSTTS